MGGGQQKTEKKGKKNPNPKEKDDQPPWRDKSSSQGNSPLDLKREGRELLKRVAALGLEYTLLVSSYLGVEGEWTSIL